MFTILIITLLVELALYWRLRSQRAESFPRLAQRRLVAQRGPSRLRLI